MAIEVRIPTILRNYTEGASEVTADGDTLAEVLENLEANHNGIKAHIESRMFDAEGQLAAVANGTWRALAPAKSEAV